LLDGPLLCRRSLDLRNELAPSHSITSSARANNDGGTVRPSAFAVLRRITSSNFVGAQPDGGARGARAGNNGHARGRARACGGKRRNVPHVPRSPPAGVRLGANGRISHAAGVRGHYSSGGTVRK